MVSNKESATGPEKKAKPLPIISTSPSKVPPDGKWGWVIVVAYGLANVRAWEYNYIFYSKYLLCKYVIVRVIEHV